MSPRPTKSRAEIHSDACSRSLSRYVPVPCVADAPLLPVPTAPLVPVPAGELVSLALVDVLLTVVVVAVVVVDGAAVSDAVAFPDVSTGEVDSFLWHADAATSSSTINNVRFMATPCPRFSNRRACIIAPMELIDILGRDGSATGLVKPKPDVHRDGDWHRAVHVWIITPDDRILVQRRALVKENNPGLWDVSCAGHISAGESVIDAAIREAQEELGIELDTGELKHVARIRASCVLNGGTYIDNEIHEIFVVRREVDVAKLRLQPEEVDDAKLVTYDELRSLQRVPHSDEYELLRELIRH